MTAYRKGDLVQVVDGGYRSSLPAKVLKTARHPTNRRIQALLVERSDEREPFWTYDNLVVRARRAGGSRNPIAAGLRAWNPSGWTRILPDYWRHDNGHTIARVRGEGRPYQVFEFGRFRGDYVSLASAKNAVKHHVIGRGERG